MITLQANVTGLRELRRKLVLTRAALRNRQKPHREIKEQQVLRWQRNYTSVGGEYGGWASGPGAFSGNVHTLWASGGTFASAMRQAWAGQVTSEQTHWDFVNTGGGVRGGAYPVSHHTGYPNPILGLAPIPAREIWPLDGQDEQRAEQIMDKYVDEVVARYF